MFLKLSEFKLKRSKIICKWGQQNIIQRENKTLYIMSLGMYLDAIKIQVKYVRSLYVFE